MIEKLQKILRQMTPYKWIIVGAWFAVLVELFGFVIIAATMTQGTAKYANTLAGVATILVITLFSAILGIVIPKFLQGKRGEGK